MTIQQIISATLTVLVLGGLFGGITLIALYLWVREIVLSLLNKRKNLAGGIRP